MTTSRRDFLAVASVAGTQPGLFTDIAPMLAAPYRHRQVFGMRRVGDGVGLHQIMNSLNAYEFARREGPGTLHAVAVLYGSAVALALTDATWQRYRLTAALGVHGDAIARPAVGGGNPFARARDDAAVNDPADPRSAVRDSSIGALMKRSVTFLVCNNALTEFATSIVTDRGDAGLPIDRVVATFRSGLIPGAILVPAGVAALNDAQEARYTYVAI